MSNAKTSPKTDCMSLQELKYAIKVHLSSIKDTTALVSTLNALRSILHQNSPFSHEPVDCVLWVPLDDIRPCNYNPNVMAPPEKRLLQHSLLTDGYTQPVVVSPYGDGYEVVDGFHRYQASATKVALRKRLSGYLPVTLVKMARQTESERMASSIRHNRARGQHQITAMSNIVRDLSLHGWADEKIALELGMDADEILRLKQISGLTELFVNTDFSSAWIVRE